MKRYNIWAMWLILGLLVGGCRQSSILPITENPTTTNLASPTLSEIPEEVRGKAVGTSTETEIPVGTATDVTVTTTQEDVTTGAVEITPQEDIQIVRLTFNDQWGDIEPVWSPDGKRLLSSRRVQDSEGTYTRDLYVMNSDGSGQGRLTDTTKGIEHIWFRGTWSPDGEKLAFKYVDLRLPGEEQGSTIALLELKSGEITEITNGNDMYAFDISWSPDNEMIAFAADPLEEEEFKFYIFLVDVNSGQITQLTFHGEETHPTWSPDGNWIVFTSEENFRYGLYLVHVEIGKIYKLIENTEKNNRYNHPNWSPDGKWIAFSAFMGNEYRDIYLLDMSWLEMEW